MKLKQIVLVALFCLPSAAFSGEPSFGPVIDGFGPTFPINYRDEPLPENFVYKAVFDAAANPDEKSLNSGLVSVARFLNMHGRNGVALENMDIAVVVHGPALKMLLQDSAYTTRFGIENPNSELFGKLRAAGVRFYVCGQSMSFVGITKNELLDGSRVALSAMTMLTILQSDGYSLLN